MVQFGSPRFTDPYQAIRHRLEFNSAKPNHPPFETDFSTLRFLKMREISQYQLHLTTFRDTIKDQQWNMSFLLSKRQIDGTWSISSRGGPISLQREKKDPHFPFHFLHPGWNVGKVPFLLGGVLEENNLDIVKVRLDGANGFSVEDDVQNDLVLFVVEEEIPLAGTKNFLPSVDFRVTLFNRAGEIISSQSINY
jgi:hypothetical protein